MKADHDSLYLIVMYFAFSSVFISPYHLEFLSGALNVSTTFWNSELATGSQNSFISSFICIEKTQKGEKKMSTSYPLSKTEYLRVACSILANFHQTFGTQHFKTGIHHLLPFSLSCSTMFSISSDIISILMVALNGNMGVILPGYFLPS